MHERIRQLISENDFNSVFELLTSIDTCHDIKSETVNLRAQYDEIEKQTITGIVSNADRDLNLNRLRNNILKLLELDERKRIIETPKVNSKDPNVGTFDENKFSIILQIKNNDIRLYKKFTIIIIFVGIALLISSFFIEDTFSMLLRILSISIMICSFIPMIQIVKKITDIKIINLIYSEYVRKKSENVSEIYLEKIDSFILMKLESAFRS